MAKTRWPGIYSRVTAKGKTVYDATASLHGRQRQSRGHPTISAAREWQAAALELMQDEDGVVAPSKLSLRSYLEDKWLPSLESSLAPASQRAYKSQIRYAISYLGDVKLTKLSPWHIEAFKRSLAQVPPIMARESFNRLREALEAARKWRLIRNNPADAVRGLSHHSPKRPALSTADIQRIISAGDKTRFGLLIRVTVATGLRWIEVSNLRWRDVDLEEGYLDVHTSKTQAGLRRIWLDADTVERLRAYRAERQRLYAEAGVPLDFVFIGPLGGRLGRKTLERFWDGFRKDLGMPDLHFHDLRQAHSSLLARAGVHPAIAQQRLGHADVSVTLGTYTRVLSEEQRAAAEGVANLLTLSKRLPESSE